VVELWGYNQKQGKTRLQRKDFFSATMPQVPTIHPPLLTSTLHLGVCLVDAYFAPAHSDRVRQGDKKLKKNPEKKLKPVRGDQQKLKHGSTPASPRARRTHSCEVLAADAHACACANQIS
jgi:hypothetical protein